MQRSARSDATKLISAIVIGSVVYQAMLAYLHTHFFRVTAFGIGAAEFVLYLACLAVLFQRIRLEFVTLISLVLAYLLLLAIIRNDLEIKGFRDVMIPVLFYWLGRRTASISLADKLLKILVVGVLVVGLFELFFLEQYTRLMDIFSYYVSTGTITINTNFIPDSALNLNGIRPEGIGRTILPTLLGSHRISSVFLEPVSLGNFAVIILAWGLSKPRAEIKQALFFVLSAIALIALSDSRYGLIVTALLIFLRIAISGRLNGVVIALPVISILMLVVIGLFFDGGLTDDLMGRLFWTGTTLLEFDVWKLFGIEGFNIPYGDMGYAYLISRWGILLCIALWGTLWMIKMPDERGTRFRAYGALYISLILTVSGTSLFALKTAGLFWYLMGCCSDADEKVEKHAASTSAAPQMAHEVKYAN